MNEWRLVSDVGGTNVRFARAGANGTLTERRSYLVSGFGTFLAALDAYLGETGGRGGCIGAAIGAAGAIDSGKVTLTNLAWEISETKVSARLGVPCKLVNDVEAVAFSLPALAKTDVAPLGALAPDLSVARRILIANIGTGFGAATLIRTPGNWIACPSEAGHMSLAFTEWPAPGLERQFTTVEHALSGHGLCNLRAAIAKDERQHTPAEIIDKAGADSHHAAALRLFTQIAGHVLGNLVLAVAAWDGVFLCGSVGLGFARGADPTLFRQAFEGTGKMSEKKKAIPVSLVTNQDAALIGLAVLPLRQ
jgi:glucokinase